MKIAWLCPYPVSELADLLEGGVRRRSLHPCSWIINLSTALAGMQEVELHLLTVSPWIYRSQTVQRNGMFIHVIRSGLPFVRRGYPGYMPLDAISGYIVESHKLFAEINRIQPDIVHAHGTERECAIAARRSGRLYVVSIQGILTEFNKTDPSIHNRLMEPYEKREVRRGHYFTCRTHFDMGFVRRLNPKAKIFNIPEAMGTIFFAGQWSDPAGCRVLFVGGGAPRKGLHELIDAMGETVKNIPEASIDVVGSCSPERQRLLENKAQQLGVSIRFHGYRSAAEIAELHRQCRMFTLCSSNENSPNTLAEAMVSGMPVVSYNVGGVSSMLQDGRSGILIAPHDTKALATAVMSLLSDRAKALAIGQSAAEFARSRNHPDHVAEETMAAYRYILEKRKDG